MTKTVVVLGAGTGGTMAANLLRKRLGRDARVVVVGENGEHVFQPANLDVAFKGARPERSVHAQRPLLARGIELATTGAARIDPGQRIVALQDGRELAYDALVLATGAIADPTLMPGLAESSLNFHTGPRDAERIWRALGAIQLPGSGAYRVVVAIAGVPYKCPPSPVEAVFLLDEHFRRRGLRPRVEIALATPYPRAYPAEPISDVVAPRLAERGIVVRTLFNMDGVDAAKKVIYSLEGEEIPYDLLIAIPPHRGAAVIKTSGLGDADGFVPTDKETMRVVGHDDIFALGDATAIPISKSGVVAHLEAGVVAENVTRFLRGEPGARAFEGRINCPMEVGGHEALFVSATYERPARKQRPNVVRYAMKKTFGHMYWRSLKGQYEWIFRPYFGRTSHEKPPPARE
jgi:sulfide:quinone oxidoreductase